MEANGGTMDDRLFRQIPAMNLILEHPRFADVDRERVKRAAQAYLEELRGSLASLQTALPGLDECTEAIGARIAAEDVPRLRRLINATGVVLHTNLGRAPLGRALGSAIAEICAGYCNLEYDLDAGRRGSRNDHVEGLLCELTGAQAAMAVNNNAAAVFLMLSALAKGKRVAVSRGELVEIGGGFRIPEIMEQSGAELVEVGTTNRTRLSDYAAAVDKKGAELLLKVHTSNYQILGFTESVPAEELAAFGRQRGLPLLYDMGACFLTATAPSGLAGLAGAERLTARAGIASGADLICFSGDKLLGAVQAGILAGRGDLVELMKTHPVNRMARPDKLTLAALEAALQIYRCSDGALRRIPVLAMLAATPNELRLRAEALASRLRPVCGGWEVRVAGTADEAGGGAMPDAPLPGWAVALCPTQEAAFGAGELERRLRHGPVPLVAFIRDNAVLLSLRTILPGEEDEIAIALELALRAGFRSRASQ